MERNWPELETQIPLERLPDFHRAFLKAHGVEDPEAMPLRRVQQAVQRELNKLVAAGAARRDGDELWVQDSALSGIDLEAFLGAEGE